MVQTRGLHCEAEPACLCPQDLIVMFVYLTAHCFQPDDVNNSYIEGNFLASNAGGTCPHLALQNATAFSLFLRAKNKPGVLTARHSSLQSFIM